MWGFELNWSGSRQDQMEIFCARSVDSLNLIANETRTDDLIMKGFWVSADMTMSNLQESYNIKHKNVTNAHFFQSAYSVILQCYINCCGYVALKYDRLKQNYNWAGSGKKWMWPILKFYLLESGLLPKSAVRSRNVFHWWLLNTAESALCFQSFLHHSHHCKQKRNWSQPLYCWWWWNDNTS